jgi:hypothetical protein
MSQAVEAHYPAAARLSERALVNLAPADTPSTIPHAAVASEHPRDLPDSQESVFSAASSTFSALKLPSSGSTVSTSTSAETEDTFHVAPNQSKPIEAPMPAEADARADAPRIDAATANAPRTGDTAASPMSLESPIAQGFKRAADGSVKGSGQAMHSSARPATAHKRNKSMDTHAGTRIGEVRVESEIQLPRANAMQLSAQLKTRLSYAMVKVQNGWEKQSLDELEEVQSQRSSPNSAPGRSDRLVFDSPSAFDRNRRPSQNSDQMLISPMSDTSRSHAATSSCQSLSRLPATSTLIIT